MLLNFIHGFEYWMRLYMVVLFGELFIFWIKSRLEPGCRQASCRLLLPAGADLGLVQRGLFWIQSYTPRLALPHGEAQLCQHLHLRPVRVVELDLHELDVVMRFF